jgi:8-amino-7-oxononanoate synthase
MILLDQIDEQLKQLSAASLIRRRRITETACTPHVTVDGKPVLAFCSNDYLGLAAHPQIVAALQEGAKLYGAGSGASHLISGHSLAHAVLEERLAEFLSPHLLEARALYFCTGYMANLAVLTALASIASAGKTSANTIDECVIFSERLNHASLIDGARLARAKLQVYPHADEDALETLLKKSTASTKIVVTDSVFSMDGNLAPLPALLQLCEQYNAWLVVDDAHGFGVLGEHGRGALEHFQLNSPHLIYMGTLGKAAGVGGAFIAAHASVIEWLIQKARPYIYTTAAPPALAHALLTSLDIIEGAEGDSRRQHLQNLIQIFTQTLQVNPWQLLASPTAIQPIVIGENSDTLSASANLYAQGLWVGAIRPPTVAAGSARLRVTLSAAHTQEDVERLIWSLNNLDKLPVSH